MKQFLLFFIFIRHGIWPFCKTFKVKSKLNRFTEKENHKKKNKHEKSDSYFSHRFSFCENNANRTRQSEKSLYTSKVLLKYIV